MEYSFDNIHSFTLPVRTSPDSGATEGYGFVHEGSNRTLQSYPESDFFLPVFLTKTSILLDYVEITHDETIFVMQRQEVNPWFIEFLFFDSIKRNKVNEGADLFKTSNTANSMIDFVKSISSDALSLTDSEIISWFDLKGKNEINLDDLDRANKNIQNIISKAFFYNIDINK